MPANGTFFSFRRRFHGLSGGLWSPSLLRITPVNRLQQITHLTRRQRYRTVHGLRPDKPTSIQTFGIQRQAEAIMPKRLNQRTAPSAKNVDIAGERITAETFLHLQGQTPHPRRISVCPDAIQIRTPVGIGITRATPPGPGAERPGSRRYQPAPACRYQVRSRSNPMAVEPARVTNLLAWSTPAASRTSSPA